MIRHIYWIRSSNGRVYLVEWEKLYDCCYVEGRRFHSLFRWLKATQRYGCKSAGFSWWGPGASFLTSTVRRVRTKLYISCLNHCKKMKAERSGRILRKHAKTQCFWTKDMTLSNRKQFKRSWFNKRYRKSVVTNHDEQRIKIYVFHRKSKTATTYEQLIWKDVLKSQGKQNTTT